MTLIFSYIRSIAQRTLIIRISQRYSPGSPCYLSIENNQVIGHQVHITVYLQTVAMAHKRRIARNYTILEIIIISNRLPFHIRRHSMISQLVIHDILALVLVEFIIEKQILIFRMELVHRITEHQIFRFGTRHFSIPETELIDTSLKILPDNK